jgi:hypothetical protein
MYNALVVVYNKWRNMAYVQSIQTEYAMDACRFKCMAKHIELILEEVDADPPGKAATDSVRLLPLHYDIIW